MTPDEVPTPIGQIVRWHACEDVASMQQAAYRWIVDASVNAIAERGRFVLALAGGNTPRGVYAMLRDADTDWSQWHIWFGDERCAPVDDPQRNSAMARKAWLDHVPIPALQIHAIAGESGPEAAAYAYSTALRDIGDFDLVLLGLGEDGHTASLFPGTNGALHRMHPMRSRFSPHPSPHPSASPSAHRASDAHARWCFSWKARQSGAHSRNGVRARIFRRVQCGLWMGWMCS